MTKIIRNYKSKKEFGEYYYKLLKDVSCSCNSLILELIKNERSDASYEYTVYCPFCMKKIGRINWEGEFYVMN